MYMSHRNLFKIKKRALTEKLLGLTGSSQFLSHKARISLEFDSRKDSHLTKLRQRPRKLVKLSFKELCDSKISGFRTFDIMGISLIEK